MRRVRSPTIFCGTAKRARRARALNRASIEYYRYINSPAWAAKRAAFHASSHPHSKRCYVCQRPHRRGWQVHHLTYKRLGYESFDDLTIACPDCHDAIHEYHQRAKQSGRRLSLQAASDEVRLAYPGSPKINLARIRNLDWPSSTRHRPRYKPWYRLSRNIVLLILGLIWVLLKLVDGHGIQPFGGSQLDRKTISTPSRRDVDRAQGRNASRVKKPKKVSPERSSLPWW